MLSAFPKRRISIFSRVEISTSTIFIVQHTLPIFPVFTITAFEKQITLERKIARSRTREIGKTEIKKEGHSDTANVVEHFASNLHLFLFLSLLVSSFPSFLFRLRPPVSFTFPLSDLFRSKRTGDSSQCVLQPTFLLWTKFNLPFQPRK